MLEKNFSVKYSPFYFRSVLETERGQYEIVKTVETKGMQKLVKKSDLIYHIENVYG